MNNKTKNSQNFDNEDYLKASSAQDCTGLIPSGLIYEEEVENYEDLYPFLPHAVKKEEGSI